jgi:hypothetical protein
MRICWIIFLASFVSESDNYEASIYQLHDKLIYANTATAFDRSKSSVYFALNTLAQGGIQTFRKPGIILTGISSDLNNSKALWNRYNAIKRLECATSPKNAKG